MSLRVRRDDDGFGLVEVIIAMVLLAIIAMALLPALWNGIQYSAEQSSVASATRYLNAVMEQLRDADGSCTDLRDMLADSSITTAYDGRGGTVTVRITGGGSLDCGAGPLVDVPLEALLDGKSIVSIHGKVWAP